MIEPEQMSMQTQVCILGAGVTGLAAGFTLTQADVPAVLVERDDEVGGLSRTFRHNGFRFDLGGHRFFTKNERVQRFVEELMGDEMISVDRKSSIYYRRKYFDYPIRIPNVLRNLGLLEALRVILSYSRTKVRRAGGGAPRESVEDWITDQFGEKLYDIFFRSYTAKVWGLPGNQISQEWAGQRIKGFSLPVALRHAVFKTSRNRPKTLIERFTYPELGIGRICERMADEIERRNQILLNSSVRAINHDHRRVTSVDFQSPHRAARISAEQFISSIPLTLMIRLLNPAPPAEVVEAARQVRFRGLIVLHLIVNREQVTDQSWVYIQEPSCLISRIHEPKNWSRRMVPEGMTSLVVEIPYTDGDELSRKTNREITDLAVRALETELHFVEPGEVLDSFLIRLPCAYPVYHLGYQEPLGRIMSYLEGFENLQTSGRSGLHKYANLDHCIECGIQAAENLLGAAYDLRLLVSEREYMEAVAS